MRLTEEQAANLGLGKTTKISKKRTKKRPSKREQIQAYLKQIQEARCTVKPIDNGIEIRVVGLGIPSLNKMLHWDQKTEAYSYKKAWHELVYNGVLESNIKRTFKTIDQACTLSITAFHTRLLDMDNVCPKYLIDGIVRAGIIKDDNMKFIAGYSVNQQRTEGRVPSILVMLKVNPSIR